MAEPTTSQRHDRPPVVRLIVSWALVSLPLLWGVSQTVLKALALFE